MANRADRVPFRRSLQFKFAALFILLIAAVLLVLNTYPVLASQDLVFQSKQNFLQNQANMVGSALAAAENLTTDNVTSSLEQLGSIGVTRILVTDASGCILYDSDDARENVGHYSLMGEVTTALHGYDVFHSEYQDGAFRSRAAAPVIYRNMTIGAVYLYEYDPDQAALLAGMQSKLQMVSAVVSVAAVLLSLLFSSALTRRIADLLRAIRIVREGNYSHRVPFRGGDELSRLAGEFNELTDRLQTTEKVRRRFVSDASHELKTPLASIRLLTDSILQSDRMDLDTARDFVSDIGEEADRLTRISEKLLTLTRMDSAVPVQNMPVNVAKTVRSVEHMLSPLAAQQGISMELELDSNCVVLATDDDLYQIIFNLMENAVKYNQPGGRVMVNLRAEGDLVTLTVEDTGVGIPEEDLSKVFDRFYRVDKARSRSAGGTGLGLSIVRDTARQHGGAVTVHRRAPEGTCFTVSLPRWHGEEERQP
ncbi:MAG: HAMP domain-containing histidine kinase [Intestinimonas sp.]|jgi:signal transduction histidine kinase|nr:HAMP domain-containing histidine kinase [Intestinimonas sp.]